MVIISVAIHKARKEYKCSDCHKWIEISQKYLRMYGMAHEHETPYELFNHLDCIKQTGGFSKDLLKALDKAKIKYTIWQGELLFK